MYLRKSRTRGILLRWIAVILTVCIILLGLFNKTKPLIYTYAKSTAETIMLNAANNAILSVLEKESISYDEIAVISRDTDNNITAIEIDTAKTNILKSKISNEIAGSIDDSKIHSLPIPLGTLLGSEYTTGYGPKIEFRTQLTHTAVVDFKSVFIDAGINHMLHQIIITINVSANILMLGYTQGFTVSTSAIAAQTVVVGEVPDSFTQVEEHPGDDIADEIFNYAEMK